MRRTLLVSVLALAVVAPVVSASVLTSRDSAHRAARSANPAQAGGNQPRRAARIFLFGDRQVEKTVGRTAPGSAVAFPFRNRATGMALAISVYVGASSRAKRLLAALYAGKNGHPGTLLTKGSVKSPKHGAWDTVHVAPARVRPGFTYWVAILGERGRLYFRGARGRACSGQRSRSHTLSRMPARWTSRQRLNHCPLSAYVTGTHSTTGVGSGPGQSAPPTNTAPPQPACGSGLYCLPSDRTFAWNPGLNAVGGIPNRTAIYKTISPSGGDDTATIQSALNSCPTNGVVQLTAGVFHISGQGLSIEKSYCTLRGAGPGNGNPGVSDTQNVGTGTGTFLVKKLGRATRS
jgi:hypothetical protein